MSFTLSTFVLVLFTFITSCHTALPVGGGVTGKSLPKRRLSAASRPSLPWERQRGLELVHSASLIYAEGRLNPLHTLLLYQYDLTISQTIILKEALLSLLKSI